MKKYLFLMLAAVLFSACGDDEKEDVQPVNPPVETIDFADYSKAVGMSYTQMLNTYGEPEMAFDGFYSYTIGDGKTESLTLMTNSENNKVYCVMQILAEGAYKFEDLYDYFSSKYTMYEYRETGNVTEDGEESSAYATFGNAAKEEEATLLITVSDNSAVSYVDPTNMPEEPSAADFGNIEPKDVPAMFLGMSEEDLMDVYGEYISSFGGMMMINVEGNDYYTCIFFEIEDGIVAKVQLLFDDLEDEDVIAYYEALGYEAYDCGEEDGVHTYLFMHKDTNDMFTYTNPVATFVYIDPDAQDEDDDEEE